jgi:hypothetical protein
VLARSTDRGATWTQISPSDPNDLPGPPPAEEEQDPVYANTYATISAVAPASTKPDPNGYASTIYVGTDTGFVWKTTDAGQPWTQMTGILPNAPIDLGVFWAHVPSAGGGQALPTPLHWFRVGSGLPATPGMDLKINGSDTKLFVGTFGRGLWEVTLPTVTSG